MKVVVPESGIDHSMREWHIDHHDATFKTELLQEQASISASCLDKEGGQPSCRSLCPDVLEPEKGSSYERRNEVSWS